jgi:pimeloyl-ACP methyl ester carboxylesterase
MNRLIASGVSSGRVRAATSRKSASGALVMRIWTPTIQYTRSGTGTPALVFIHAFGCARSDWDARVAQFSANYETVAVDLGGHGTTPARPEHTRGETHAQDVVDLMSELDLQA